jgi:hypothetical protein
MGSDRGGEIKRDKGMKGIMEKQKGNTGLDKIQIIPVPFFSS